MELRKISGQPLIIPPAIRYELEAFSPDSGEQATAFYHQIRDRWSALDEVATTALHTLESSQGYIVLRDVPFAGEAPELRNAALVCLCSALGQIIGHDAEEGSLIWPITPDPTIALSKATFSQHDKEAELHTDSQYREMPERYFALLVVRAARDGGGRSILLPASAVLDTLCTLPYGEADLLRLRESAFPFQVPMAFSARRDGDHREYVRVPILAVKPLIRYRQDTLLAGFSAFGEPIDSPYRTAVDHLQRAINSSKARIDFHLEDGDLIIVNNHELLHGRTSFADPNRLLLRVRFSPYSSPADGAEHSSFR